MTFLIDAPSVRDPASSLAFLNRANLCRSQPRRDSVGWRRGSLPSVADTGPGGACYAGQEESLHTSRVNVRVANHSVFSFSPFSSLACLSEIWGSSPPPTLTPSLSSSLPNIQPSCSASAPPLREQLLTVTSGRRLRLWLCLGGVANRDAETLSLNVT